MEQALEMIAQAKDRLALRRRVAADAFEDRRAVMHGVRHHVRGGLGPGLDLAVVPDERRVFSGHGDSPCGEKVANYGMLAFRMIRDDCA
jgi:hypothetical protein